MRREFKIFAYFLAITVVLVLSILTANYATIGLPAILPFGMIFIVFLVVMDLFAEVCRGRSPHVACNFGHWSISVTKDIHRIPWQNDLIGKTDEKNKALGEMTIMFPGGIDYWGFNVHSSKEYPILIYPSIYEHVEGNNYTIYANLNKRTFSELSPYLRHVLGYYRRRIGKNTDIFYGATSHMDGSATPETTAIELKEAKYNKIITELETRLEIVYRELRRAGESKERRVFMGKELLPMKEEIER